MAALGSLAVPRRSVHVARENARTRSRRPSDASLSRLNTLRHRVAVVEAEVAELRLRANVDDPLVEALVVVSNLLERLALSVLTTVSDELPRASHGGA